MQRIHEPDAPLLLSAGVLLAAGLLLLASASAPVGYERFGDSYFFIKRQLLFGALPGLVIFFFLAKTAYPRVLAVSPVLWYGTLLLLVLVFIPGIGTALNSGAKSWLVLGSRSFQPSEFAKLAMILFLSALISRRHVDLASRKGFLIVLGTGAVPMVLVLLQPDIGTALVLFCILAGILFLGGARIVHLVALSLCGVALFALLIAIAPYRAARLTTFFHPELDPQGIGYHINQASVAIGSGGWWGVGLGRSRQKFQYLPEVHGDSIFAIIAEETGWIFSTFFIGLIVFLSYRIFYIAAHAPESGGALLAGGIGVWFIMQSFLNIGAMVGLLPLTGLPLPFVSHGGTALFVALAALGIVVNVSKHTNV